MAIGIPSEYIENSWRKVSPMIESVLAKFPTQGWSIEGIRLALEERDLQLWVDDHENISVVWMTKIISRTNGKECWIWLCSGELKDDFHIHLKDTEDWAKHLGCNSIVLQGRKGWAKKLKFWGGEEQVLIRKNLEQENDSKIH